MPSSPAAKPGWRAGSRGSSTPTLRARSRGPSPRCAGRSAADGVTPAAMPGDLLSPPAWWQLALFLPSLLLLLLILQRKFVREGPETAPAVWTVIDLFAILIVHVVGGSFVVKALDIPLLPRQLALG